jgi:hypothetical protein
LLRTAYHARKIYAPYLRRTRQSENKQ